MDNTRTGQGKATDDLRLISALNFFILPLRLNTATYLLLKSIVPSASLPRRKGGVMGTLIILKQTGTPFYLRCLSGRSAGLRKSFDK